MRRLLVVGGHGQKGRDKMIKGDIGIEVQAKQTDNTVLFADDGDGGGFDSDSVFIMVEIGSSFFLPASFDIFQHF